MAEGEEDRKRRSETSRNSSAVRLPHTWVVSAPPGGAPPPPLARVERGAPLLQLGVLQGIGGQVADLQVGEFTQEVTERHPEQPKDGRSQTPFPPTTVGTCFSEDENNQLARTRHPRCSCAGGFS